MTAGPGSWLSFPMGRNSKKQRQKTQTQQTQPSPPVLRATTKQHQRPNKKWFAGFGKSHKKDITTARSSKGGRATKDIIKNKYEERLDDVYSGKIPKETVKIKKEEQKKAQETVPTKKKNSSASCPGTKHPVTPFFPIQQHKSNPTPPTQIPKPVLTQKSQTQRMPSSPQCSNQQKAHMKHLEGPFHVNLQEFSHQPPLAPFQRQHQPNSGDVEPKSNPKNPRPQLQPLWNVSKTHVVGQTYYEDISVLDTTSLSCAYQPSLCFSGPSLPSIHQTPMLTRIHNFSSPPTVEPPIPAHHGKLPYFLPVGGSIPEYGAATTKHSSQEFAVAEEEVPPSLATPTVANTRLAATPLVLVKEAPNEKSNAAKPQLVDPPKSPRTANPHTEPRAANPHTEPHAASPTIQTRAANPATQPRAGSPAVESQAGIPHVAEAAPSKTASLIASPRDVREAVINTTKATAQNCAASQQYGHSVAAVRHNTFAYATHTDAAAHQDTSTTFAHATHPPAEEFVSRFHKTPITASHGAPHNSRFHNIMQHPLRQTEKKGQPRPSSQRNAQPLLSKSLPQDIKLQGRMSQTTTLQRTEQEDLHQSLSLDLIREGQKTISQQPQKDSHQSTPLEHTQLQESGKSQNVNSYPHVDGARPFIVPYQPPSSAQPFLPNEQKEIINVNRDTACLGMTRATSGLCTMEQESVVGGFSVTNTSAYQASLCYAPSLPSIHQPPMGYQQQIITPICMPRFNKPDRPELTFGVAQDFEGLVPIGPGPPVAPGLAPPIKASYQKVRLPMCCYKDTTSPTFPTDSPVAPLPVPSPKISAGSDCTPASVSVSSSSTGESSSCSGTQNDTINDESINSSELELAIERGSRAAKLACDDISENQNSTI